MQIKDFLDTINYQITEGSQYQWDCFGYNAFCLDHWDGERDGVSLSMIFDKLDQTVYQVDAHDYKNHRSYRWTNPTHVEAFKAAVAQSSMPDQAYDDVPYIDLESEADWLEKARAIFLGEPYDTRVSIAVDFTDEELLTYMKAAHDRDITFNQFVEEALTEAFKAYELDPEGMRAKAQAWKNR